MRKFFQRSSLMLAVVLLTAALAGCTAGTPGASSSGSTAPDAASASGEPQEPAHEPGLFIDEKKVDADPMMTVDGQDVSFDMFRQVYLSTRDMFDGGDASIWTGEDREEGLRTLNEYVEGRLMSYFAVEKLAKELDIAVSDEERTAAEEDLVTVKEQLGGEEAYQDALKKQYYNESLYLDFYYNSLLLNKIVRAEYGERIKQETLESYVHAQHILIPFASTEEDADHSAERTKAEEALAKVEAGDDFSALVTEYGEDPGQPADGYYFTKGEMVKEFEDSAFGLKDGETSEIVETSYGYHILKRLPMEEEYIETNLLNLVSADLQAEVFERLEALSAEMDVTYHDAYDTVEPENMF